jgi:hypothetical protein
MEELGQSRSLACRPFDHFVGAGEPDGRPTVRIARQAANVRIDMTATSGRLFGGASAATACQICCKAAIRALKRSAGLLNP